MEFFSKATAAGPVDSNGAGGSSLPSGAAAAVDSASAAAKSKRGGFRPGSGRKPSGGGIPNQTVGGAPPGKAQPDQTPASEADLEFLRTIAKAGLKILDRVETNMICALVNEIDDARIREKTDVFLKAREITEADEELVSNAAAALGAKYSFLSRYAPEAALVGWGALHGMALTGVLKELRALVVIVKNAKAKGVDLEISPASP
jgi:hypothetical protein